MFRTAIAVPFFMALLLGSGVSLAAAIQDPNMVVLPDPDLATAKHFAPGASTAGVAHIGPALDKVQIRSHDCSPTNPCALPPPAISDAAIVPPKRQRQRMRASG